ncbi:chitinase-3-like protein 1 isoform X2 [Artemia franciscana]
MTTVLASTIMFLLLFAGITVLYADNSEAGDTPSIFISPFIVGGEDANIQNYPFVVSIQFRGSHKCGGVVINNNVVLTAAHCINRAMSTDTNGWVVVAGRRDMLNIEEGQILRVKCTKIHPDFSHKATMLLHDIGLIWLDGTFNWSDSIQPAKLSKTWSIVSRPWVQTVEKFVVTTIGWGRLSHQGALPNILRQVEQTLSTEDHCLRTLQSEEAESLYNPIMFCTDDKGKEACNGDSGGPVIYDGEVVGIVSHGYGSKRGCEHATGWKMKVPFYYKWIQEEVKQGSCFEKKKVFCYYGSWSMNRNGGGKLEVDDIDPFICTDVIYAFAGLDSDSSIVSLRKEIDLLEDGGKGGYERFTSLKELNPNLKTWISVGGWDEGSLKYSQMASEGESRAKFITSVVEFLQKYGFDGVDIHWLYPGLRGGSNSDKANLVLLLRELRESLDKNGLLLSIAVGAKKDQTDTAYNIVEISRSVHYVILLTHSYHGHWEKFTGFNAPLYPQSNFTSEFSIYNNVIWTVHHWIANKVDKRKLILGIAAFGRSWILEDPADHFVGSNAIGGGTPGIFSDEFGLLSYTEICINIKNGWEEIQDNYTKSPYAFLGNRWVSYDNVWSVRLKSDLINKSVLGGAAIWSLENDDFLNFCGGGKNPLIQTVKDTLGVL